MSNGQRSDKEAQWFLENERDLIKAAALEREQRVKDREEKSKAEALQELREAHWMKCPKCGHDMNVKSIEGIEVDECGFCEGIFFDRGELDTLLMRKASQRFTFFRKMFGLS